jgi:hypothetical protein
LLKLCLSTALISVFTTIFVLFLSLILVVESAREAVSLSSSISNPSVSIVEWFLLEPPLALIWDRGCPVPFSPVFELGLPVDLAAKLLFLNHPLKSGARQGRFADMMAACISITVQTPGWACA